MSELGDNHSIDDLKLLWESDPSSKVYLELAEEYRKLGRHPEAVEVLEKSLEHRPRDPRGRVALARCLLETGDPGGAAELLEAVTRRDPEHIEAAKLLLEGCLQLGDFERASERLNIYRLLNDRDPEIDHLEYRLSLLEPKAEAGSDPPAADVDSTGSDEVSEEFSEDGFDPDPGYASFARDLPEESSPYIPAPDMATLLAADTSDTSDASDTVEPSVRSADQPVNQGVSFQFEADPSAVETTEQEAPAVPEVSAPEVSVPEVTAPEVSGPNVSVPEVTAPEVSIPEVSVPEVSAAPELSEPSEPESSSDPDPSPGQPSSAAMAAISAAARKSAAKEEAAEEPEESEAPSGGPSQAALAAIRAASQKAAAAPKKDPPPPLADDELPAIEDATGLVPLAAGSTDLFELGSAPPKPSLDDLFDLRGPATPKPTLDALWGSPEPSDEPTEPQAEAPQADADAAAEVEETEEAATATLGELYLSQGHLDEAEEIFDRVLKQDPGNAAALEGKAKLESARVSEAAAEVADEVVVAEEEPVSDPDSVVSGEPSSAAQAAIEAASRAASARKPPAEDLEVPEDLEITEPMPVQPDAAAGDESSLPAGAVTSSQDSQDDFEIHLVPEVEPTPEVDAIPEIDPIAEIDAIPVIEPSAELSQQPEPLEIAPEPAGPSLEEPATAPSGEPSAAARAAIEAAARAQEAKQPVADSDVPKPAAPDPTASDAESAKRDLLTAADLLADRSLKGVIPEGLTAKKILVLDQYAKHLRKTSQDHVH